MLGVEKHNDKNRAVSPRSFSLLYFLFYFSFFIDGYCPWFGCLIQ